MDNFSIAGGWQARANRWFKYAVVGLIGMQLGTALIVGANGLIGWWGEARTHKQLRDIALAEISKKSALPGDDALCHSRLQHVRYGSITGPDRTLEKRFPAIIGQRQVACANPGQGEKVVDERWVMLGLDDAEDTLRCLAVGKRVDIDRAKRRCGFTGRSVSEI